MIIYILSGASRTGKDSLVEAVTAICKSTSKFLPQPKGSIYIDDPIEYEVCHLSTITFVYNMLWANPFLKGCVSYENKSVEQRELLCNMKKLLDDYYRNYTMQYADKMHIGLSTQVMIDALYGHYKKSSHRETIVFIDCREPYMIKELKEAIERASDACEDPLVIKVIKTERAGDHTQTQSDIEAANSDDYDMLLVNDSDIFTMTMKFMTEELIPTLKSYIELIENPKGN